jgi:PIN domain nuclease of toxin-antitoxin system
VKLLLDTCVLLWLSAEPDKLSAAARDGIDDEANDLLVSHASVWELALKGSAGKLSLPAPLRTWLADQQLEWGFHYVPISLEHLLRTEEIHRHHADPFDRLIICQGIVDQLAVVTPDSKFSEYPVRVLW